MILHNENLSLEGIGFEVGFNSKSTFFATFKKIKEVTPAQFKSKLLKK
jgi:AraC-like DNA-binding protein